MTRAQMAEKLTEEQLGIETYHEIAELYLQKAREAAGDASLDHVRLHDGTALCDACQHSRACWRLINIHLININHRREHRNS